MRLPQLSPWQQARERESWPVDITAPRETAAKQWFALHVRSSQEGVVSGKLERAGVEAFYPFRLTLSKDKRRSTETKFMPGYVFARFADNTAAIAIPQVVGIVGAGRHAIAIPEYEIESVKLIQHPPQASPCEYLAAGTRVRVKYGPLTGLEGFVERWKKQAWVIVSLTSVERSIKAEVDPQCLEPIEQRKTA